MNKTQSFATFMLAAAMAAVYALPAAALFPENATQLADENFSLQYVRDQANISRELFVTENEPPRVTRVSIFPAEPVTGQPVQVNATIENNQDMTISRPLEAYLHYSTDRGATWETVEMESIDRSRTSWSAEIPAMNQPANVNYFFSAEDDLGNLLVELPDGVAAAPAAFADRDDSSRIVQDDLDILQAGVAFDGSHLTFSMDVQGAVTPGTVSPLSAHIYSVGIYYSEDLNDGTIRPDLLLHYAAHAHIFKLPDVALMDTERDLAELDDAQARASINGRRLDLQIRADALRHGFDSLRIIFGTAHVTKVEYRVTAQANPALVGAPIINVGLQNIAFEPVDATAFVNVVRSDRSFTVQPAGPAVIGMAK